MAMADDWWLMECKNYYELVAGYWWLFVMNDKQGLVGGIPTPMKNMSSSVGMIIPPLWKMMEFVSWDDFPFPIWWESHKNPMVPVTKQWGFTKFTALSHQHLHQFEDFPASHYPIIPLFSLYKNHITNHINHIKPYKNHI